MKLIVIVIVICSPTEHLGVHKNSLKCIRALQIELEFEVFVFNLGGGKTVLP